MFKPLIIVSNAGYKRLIVSSATFCIFLMWLIWWVNHNPLPDGYQNEYLHVGNTFDLFEAFTAGDWWHVRWYAYTSYWPWGFYAIPVPVLLFLGKGIDSLIISNVLYLIPLLWSMFRLAERFQATMSPYILLLFPAVFGALTRFEPNFANVAFPTHPLADPPLV